MTTIHKQATVPYSAEKMYTLVDNIQDYPKFLPWCQKSVIRSRNDHEVVACLTLAFGGIHKSFTTRNLLQPHKMIEIKLVDGPFRHLEGFWHFTPKGENICQVSVTLNFEFRNRMIGMAFGRVFEPIARSLVDKFVAHAHAIYGENTNKNLS